MTIKANRYVSLSEQTAIVANGIAVRAAFMHWNTNKAKSDWIKFQADYPKFVSIVERKQNELFDYLASIK